MSRRHWQDWEIEAVAQLYQHVPTAELAEALARPLSGVYHQAKRMRLQKSAAYRASPMAHRMLKGDRRGAGTRFEKGHVPSNKGLRRPGWSRGRMVETQFKKGRRAEDARNYRPIGSLRIMYGNLERKVTDDPNLYPAKRWVPIQRLVWEAAHGPIPAGHIVVFKPGCHTTVESEISADRLECFSKAENMRRNSYHTHLPPEARQVVQLRGAPQSHDQPEGQSPMKNKMQHVRDHLIAQMEAIRDADSKDTEALKAELDKGRVLSEIGKVLTDTARVEVEAMKVLDRPGLGTGFLQIESTEKTALPAVRN